MGKIHFAHKNKYTNNKKKESDIKWKRMKWKILFKKKLRLKVQKDATFIVIH